MERYSEYKDSGVEWIGEKPSGWLTSKFKFITSLQTGNSLNDEMKKLYESNNKEDIPYVSSKDINVKYKTVNYNNGLRIPKETNPLKVSAKGSFLLCVEGGSAGKKMVFLKEDVCFVNKLCSFKSKQNTKYQFYFIQSSQYQSKFKSALTGLIGGVSISSLRDFELLLPPLKEQEQIVTFLDDKTKKIDDLLAKTTSKIALLKEKRMALINHCVTKGLNPNTPMKDSGVEWIGEITSGWECSKFNYNIYIKEGPGIMAVDFKETGIPLIRISGVKENFVSLKGCNFLTEEKVSDKWSHFKLKKGDILISGSASTELVSEVDSVTIGAIPYTGLIILRPKNVNLIKEYIKLFVGSKAFFTQIDTLKTGSTMEHFGPSHLNRMFFLLPSKDDQQKIVDYLDELTSKIDETINNEEKRIELLKEYRQSLISNVVTGKIKVCK